MVCFCSPRLPSSWDPSCLFPPSLLPFNGTFWITDIMKCFFVQIEKGRIISCRTSSKCFIKCHNVFLNQVNSRFFSYCIKCLYFFSTETSLNKSLSSSCLFSLVFDCSSFWKFLFQTFTFFGPTFTTAVIFSYHSGLKRGTLSSLRR